jgi:ubiquinone biosynthesis protein UbiJ
LVDLPKLDPTLHVALLGAAEEAINRALPYAPQTQATLAKLEGQSVQATVTEPHFNVTIILGKTLQLRAVYEEKVDASIEGTLREYLAAAAADDPAIALINGNLRIRGDSRLMQSLQSLVSELDIDWEAPIAAVVGDVAGHQIGKTLRGLFAWGKQSRSSVERQLSEFILEEARLSPSKLELEDFYRDIRKLQQNIDRAEAKLKRLARQRGS